MNVRADLVLVVAIWFMAPMHSGSAASSRFALQNHSERHPRKVVLPTYPWSLRPAGLSAAFCVAIQITPLGEVSSAYTVREDLPFPNFDAAVFTADLFKAIRQWRYPSVGHERRVLLRVRYSFWTVQEKAGATFEAPEMLEIRGAEDPAPHPAHMIWGRGKGPRWVDLTRDPCDPVPPEKK